ALEAKELWDSVLGVLQKEISPANYNTWLKDSQGFSYQGGVFVISVPNAFTAEWLRSRMLSVVKQTLMRLTGERPDVEIRLGAAPESRAQRLFTLNPQYTFDTFVPGLCNQLAYRSAQKVVEHSQPQYNPLCIYSGTGLGKTHLLQAIAHKAWSQGMSFKYVHAEDYTNDFVTSLEQRQGQAFRRRYRTLDLLIVDDVHFLGGKNRTEEGFLFTLDELRNKSRQIVVSCDRPPQDTPLGLQLRSRLQGGLAAGLEPPDEHTCIAILRSKAQQHHLNIPLEALELITAQGRSNVRELEGRFNQVLACSEIYGDTLSMDMVKDLFTAKEPPLSQRITQAVAQYLHMPVSLLLSRRRQPRVVLGRQFIIFLLRERLGLTMQQIANQLGLAKSSVIHSYAKIARLLPQQPDLQQAISAITASLDVASLEPS
ncbi:MAG: chromosomal replication initiator protein DnaA, partial [Chloroflexota bacterium]